MLVLAFRIEFIIDAIIKVLIVDYYQCAQQENVERKQCMIMETKGNCDISKTIGEDVTQGLER